MKTKDLILIIVSVLSLLIIVLFLVLSSPQISGKDTVEVSFESVTDETISINDADLYSLARLPGIGFDIAERIIEYREEYGDFLFLKQIMEIDGIGQGTYSRILPFITL